jgi:hypothetical protein
MIAVWPTVTAPQQLVIRRVQATYVSANVATLRIRQQTISVLQVSAIFCNLVVPAAFYPAA